jgi:hypothetical protein
MENACADLGWRFEHTNCLCLSHDEGLLSKLEIEENTRKRCGERELLF